MSPKPLIKCRNCKGEGHRFLWWGAVKEICGLCRGSGRISRRADYLGGYQWIGEEIIDLVKEDEERVNEHKTGTVTKICQYILRILKMKRGK